MKSLSNRFKKKRKQVKWNLNDYILIKLTDRGRYIHRQRHEELMKVILANGGEGFSYTMPREDENGFSKWQGWDLMQTFGPYMGLAMENVCELNVFIEPTS